MNPLPTSGDLARRASALLDAAGQLHLELAALGDSGVQVPAATRHALDLELRDLTSMLTQLAAAAHQQRLRAAA